MEALHIPPSHVYGTGAIAFQGELLLHGLTPSIPQHRADPGLLAVALKLCLLFPNQVLSLAMSGISGLFSEPMQKQALEELNQAWCFPEDEGDFYEVS